MIKGADELGARTPYLKLSLLTCLAVLVHGYHSGTDDAEIYLPAVKKFIDPSLYPYGDEFFMSHGRLSLFSNLVGLSAKLLHIPVDAAVFIWHIAGIFLLLLASWKLLGSCFESLRARWTGVCLLAGVLAVPVTNTALVIMDPYLTARSLSTPATIFVVSYFLSRNYKSALAWWLFTALVHPQMSVYILVFVGLMAWGRRSRVPRLEPEPVAVFGIAPAMLMPSILPHGFELQPAQDPYREALLMRSYFFLYNWAWYEWCGVVFPIAILWAFTRLSLRGTLPAFRQVSRALVLFGTLSVGAALLVSLPERMQMFARLQPMRSLHLVYIIFFLFLGALIGEYFLNRSTEARTAALSSPQVRAALLFVPLACGMWIVGARTYPASPHVEWPGLRWRNPYISAFFWIRDNTPKNAVFALDPQYMSAPGVDEHGFRAMTGRSVLADCYKDSGAVTMFPQLADEWNREIVAQAGWTKFQAADFERLAQTFPVTWVMISGSNPAGFDCPYRDQNIAVCRIPRI